jgi:hypothetical protein
MNSARVKTMHCEFAGHGPCNLTATTTGNHEDCAYEPVTKNDSWGTW